MDKPIGLRAILGGDGKLMILESSWNWSSQTVFHKYIRSWCHRNYS